MSIMHYENVLSEESHKIVRDALLGRLVPWYYTAKTISDELFGGASKDDIMLMSPIIDKSKDAPMFQHSFVHDYNVCSYNYDVCDLFLHNAKRNCQLPPYKVVRAKANLMLRDSVFPIGFCNRPHIDTYDLDSGGAHPRYKSFLYYVNDADGDTFIFNERFNGTKQELTIAETVRPVANTAVMFDSHQYHTSSSPREAEARVVINVVFDTELRS